MMIGTTRQAVELLAPLFASARGETVAVAHIGRDNRLLALTVESPGGEDEVELPIREILIKALRIGSSGIVVAHNHPSGDPSPSPADEAATRALAAAAAEVEIRLQDHLIFAGRDWRSFRSLGLL
jgi:DNA repair protein RadC